MQSERVVPLLVKIEGFGRFCARVAGYIRSPRALRRAHAVWSRVAVGAAVATGRYCRFAPSSFTPGRRSLL